MIVEAYEVSPPAGLPQKFAASSADGLATTNAEVGLHKTIGEKEERFDYTERRAVRVVAFNATGEVAIVYAERENYYKLPGGGIEPGEEHHVAVPRETQEETGASIKVREGGYIATTEEFRNDLHQISYCYVAELVSDAGAPSLTEEEIQDKLQHRWLPVEQAKSLMAAAEPKSTLGRYIKERDSDLLMVATK